MPLIRYIQRRFNPSAIATIESANQIIEEYEKQGYELTLRQLYYQFVARDLIENTMRAYKKLGNIINNGRLAGLIDWDSIVDRTRNLQSNSHWDSPKQIVETCVNEYQIDKWVDQERRVEVWIEKDALVGVIERVCRNNDVAFFSCRGYTSQSELWAAGRRLKTYIREGQEPVVIHLGDHDPSGVDMTRDIQERLEMFAESKIEVNRIALNMDQIKQYRPPPNPAKKTDKRAKKYIKKYGPESWELDALEPQVIEKLVQKAINQYLNKKLYTNRIALETEHKERLSQAADDLEE